MNNKTNIDNYPSQKDNSFLSFDECEEKNIVKDYVLPLTLMVGWVGFVIWGTWLVCF
jgi:hypothetical protein